MSADYVCSICGLALSAHLNGETDCANRRFRDPLDSRYLGLNCSAVQDSATGFDVAPKRYTAQGRETIDRIRDILGDNDFIAFCLGNALKYEDRAGHKGDAGIDRDKARWYRAMMLHVGTGSPDPRSNRPGFAPYKRILSK